MPRVEKPERFLVAIQPDVKELPSSKRLLVGAVAYRPGVKDLFGDRVDIQ